MKPLYKVFESKTEPLSNLEDGIYKALRYGYTLELEDGRMFTTDIGVRCSRRYCGGWKQVTVKNGILESILDVDGDDLNPDDVVLELSAIHDYESGMEFIGKYAMVIGANCRYLYRAPKSGDFVIVTNSQLGTRRPVQIQLIYKGLLYVIRAIRRNNTTKIYMSSNPGDFDAFGAKYYRLSKDMINWAESIAKYISKL